MVIMQVRKIIKFVIKIENPANLTEMRAIFYLIKKRKFYDKL
jgi:hypothetical protein